MNEQVLGLLVAGFVIRLAKALKVLTKSRIECMKEGQLTWKRYHLMRLRGEMSNELSDGSKGKSRNEEGN